ncbi:WD repeat-containing protein 3 [Periplaneta americana]|uniref:WD repeat-containing protein 3 n=1 Tax=Periplaneta americana TaxID=6978 RepID=UPI0037E8051C
MGLTKQYLRYIPAGNFNIIASTDCNVVFLTLEGQEGRYVGVAACEDIIIWDMRLGERALVLPGDKYEVTQLASSPDKRFLAAGYSDGTVKVFNLKSGENVTSFSGHRGAITCLTYDEDGHRLASGAKDTDIIIWDVVAEAGLHRLTGHKGIVTQVRFLNKYNVLVSGSKDTFVKFWDLDTSHCFKTLVGHRSEVWGLTLVKEDKYLVTGCGDSELRVWSIVSKDSAAADSENVDKVVPDTEGFVTGEEGGDLDGISPLQCKKAGSVLRSGRGRVTSLTSDNTGQVIGCHGTDGLVELFHFCSDQDANNRFKKRQRKERKKAANLEEAVSNQQQQEMGLKDEVRRLASVKVTDSKVKSVDIVMGRGEELRVALTLNSNCVELYSLHVSMKEAESRCLRKISGQGHHSEVRSVAFSSDNLAIVSASAESIKMWNRPSLACLRTVQTDYVLTSCFVPGDRHVLVGLKSGHMLIVDIVSGDVLEDVPAHSSELWSICLMPDQRGCVSGGSDATVKFWQFELINDPNNTESKAKVLSVLHTRTLKLEENVLCVRISPNNRLIAVALLDSTVQIFFVDTLKFFISLYGHKLPVLCMDISSDSTLIATGSADRNVKIWGLDFGDCHRSLFAHDDSVTGLQFVPRTHQFFTCGKDGRVKQWDADSFDKIITLQAHHGEARSLAVSPNGQYVVSCGSDRVLRLFERSAEPLVLEDEAEEEREALDNEALVTGEETTVPGHIGLNLPSKKTVGSEKAAEQLLECLEICRDFRAKLDEYNEQVKAAESKKKKPPPPPQPPALMVAYQASTPEDFLIEILQRIRSSDLEEALLLLPFTSVCELLGQLPALLDRGHQTELVCRTMIFLFRVHHSPIVNNQALLPIVGKLQQLAINRVTQLRDMVGYNLHGLQFLQRELEAKEGIQLFRDATLEKKNKDRQKKKKERVAKRALMML